ncbi:amino acid transporter [Arthrobacter sp. 1088]|uniref:hypothetical protein n=1 Tax=Arthrobacter sp. 1088 TaxID=2817768 RepID=UPI002866906C|nr:hypothetical protein [Arthrobacter sp. 1088]MDR6685773.1 amino acid transporter [Arthrobacter sp. 1088]
MLWIADRSHASSTPWPQRRVPATFGKASCVSLLAFVLDLLTISSLISFGALVAFSIVNLSVIKHYYFDQKDRGTRGVIYNLILPGIGFALTIWLWTSLSGLSFTFGLAWAGVGLVYLAILTRGFRRPAPQLD